MVEYRVVVRGALPSGLETALRQRFGVVRFGAAPQRAHAGCTAIDCSVGDQAALRALLTQVWDVGGQLVLLADVTSPAPGPAHPRREQESP